MSIFKSTLKPEIAAQLKAREKVVSSNIRSDEFLRYTSGKNSWVRMTSFVNYDSKKYDPSTGTLVNDGKYTGDQLSRKYILEGGTLYNTGGNNFSLRSGVGKYDGVYASNIDKISNNPTDNKVDRMYGLRPMPGITNVSVMNKNAYGSLREATVQFYAWDKHQLEELELLFMRTGYTVFLEWGWSQYLDHDPAGSNGINTEPDNIKLKPFNIKTFDVFSPKPNEDAIYDEIDKSIEKARGNYDAMLGFVKNFSWQLMPNGGFQCSTTLVSRGEAIETIKASANPYTILGSAPDPLVVNNANQPQPVYSVFEKIFLNIIGHVNESEFLIAYGNGISNVQGSFSINGITYPQIKQLQDQAESVYNDINKTIMSGSYKGVDVNGDIGFYSIPNLDDFLLIKFCEGQEEGTAIEYINMNAFIAILNEFFIFKDKNSPYKTSSSSNDKYPPAITILLPIDTPCLASQDSVSIDPTTCLIKNSQATLITGDTTGFSPDVYSKVDFANITTSTVANSPTGSLNEFITSNAPKTNIGAIGNIYISINKIIQRYREHSGGPNGVDVITLLQSILDDVSFALGGINDFKLYNTKNIVQIIDVKYLDDGKKDSKFKFDLIGLKSICRDVKINSRVFAEQATMMAIGATSSHRGNNLGDIYSSTQNYFNQGLEDRVLSTSYSDVDESNLTATDPTNKTIKGPQAYYIALYNQIQSLTSYLKRNVLGELNGGVFHVTKLPNPSDIINAGSLLKTLHYQIDGKDVDYKAIIPFELEITLDGIGGFIVGQIFTIDKSILPRDYYNKNLGFIVLGISHSLQNNDWITTLKTQICLLENDSIVSNYKVDRDKLVGILNQIGTVAYSEGLILCALADFMTHIFLMNFLLTREGDGFSVADNLAYDNNIPLLDINGGAKLRTKFSPAYNIIGSAYTGKNWAQIAGTSTAVPPAISYTFPNSTGIAFNTYHIIENPYNYVRRAFTTVKDVDNVEEYLKNWYAIQANDPANINNPSFPQTYNDFKSTVDFSKFKELLIGVGNQANFDSVFTNNASNPAVISTAWDKFWINQIARAASTDYINIPMAEESGLTSYGTLVMDKTNANAPTLSQIQQVPFSKDKDYFTFIDSTLIGAPVPSGQTKKISISPFETKLLLTKVTYNNFYRLRTSDGLLDVFSKSYNFLLQNKKSLGLDPNLSSPILTPTQFNLEKVL